MNVPISFTLLSQDGEPLIRIEPTDRGFRIVPNEPVLMLSAALLDELAGVCYDALLHYYLNLEKEEKSDE